MDKISKIKMFIIFLLIGLFCTIPKYSYCKWGLKEDKELQKQNRDAMNNAPINKSNRWRPFTRAVNPGENIEKNGIKKSRYLLSGHLRGRTPSQEKYKAEMGIQKDHKKKMLVKGWYKPETYKQTDIKGAGTKHYSKQEIATKNVPPQNVKVTKKTLLR